MACRGERGVEVLWWEESLGEGIGQEQAGGW